jgi:hypothetical protein
MRYRALSADGDYTFGQGSKNFLVNSAAAAGQAVLTRLRLMKREWFLDNTEGTPYSDEILGTGTKALYDHAIRTRILGTKGINAQGVRVNVIRKILNYSSTVVKRKLTVTATLDTIYGVTTIQQVF